MIISVTAAEFIDAEGVKGVNNRVAQIRELSMANAEGFIKALAYASFL